MKKVLYLFLAVIFLCFFTLSCVTRYETVYEGVVEKTEYSRNSWSGDYYVVTFTDGLVINISKRVGDLPIAGKKYNIIRCTSAGSTWHKLKRID